MKRALIIGDSHLKISILDEARSYISQLLELIRSEKYDKVILLGDQLDSFAVVRSEILSLWTEFFVGASKHSQIIALVGNHDLSGANGGTNPMEPFNTYENVWIVKSPVVIDGNHYIPFIRENAVLETYLRGMLAGSIGFCHNSFQGCTFENGFYDPHGADPTCAAHLAGLISGHVHEAQELGNIWYPGTPFPHSFGEAGKSKFIYEIKLGPSTYNIVKRIALKMPRFEVIQTKTVAELAEVLRAVSEQVGQSMDSTHYKLIAEGTPSEIAQFWADPIVKDFRSRSKRVVDALTSMRPEANLPGVKGKTQAEKLHEFIKSKKWRSEPSELSRLAEQYLSE